MDKATLLQSLQGTLDSSQQVRKQSEQQLHVFEEQPGFTAYLLELVVDPEISAGIQISAAIFFKNRIANYWVVPENRPNTKTFIQSNEKPMIKEKLIQTLIKTYQSTRMRQFLSTALHNILSYEKWEELVPIMQNLLNNSSNIDHVYTGLICLYEYSKNYRWDGLESANSITNPVLDEVAEKFFPLLETLANNLLENDSTLSDELLYLIVKIFKFTTFSYLPKYLENPTHLGTWCHLQIVLINKPLPKSVTEEDMPDQRNLNPRVKAVKWCFGNLHRLLSRHGGGFATKNKDTNTFAHSFLQNFVTEILNAYWTIIENWSSKKVWLSESSLYHLISFMEQLMETPAWPLVSDKLDAVIKHIILPTLNATEETVELYEDDEEEYIRRFFDFNREDNTSDVASINFVYRLASKKFDSTISTLLAILNDIFSRRAANRQDLATAMETEGALRVLSSISFKLDKNGSPIQGRVDEVISSYVLPELSSNTISNAPFLTARACDTIAIFTQSYRDQKVLQEVFQGVVQCFQQEKHLSIRITAVDALRTLSSEDLVADQISEQAPQLMQTLLEMSKAFESDILTSVMETFVGKFARNLEPYAKELSSRLVEQFIKLASELLEDSSKADPTVNTNKEFQAAGILNTLTTLVVAMNSSPDVADSLEVVLSDLIKFILENSMISFLTEAIEILESLLFSVQMVTPTLWNLFQVCIDSFDTYASEYFDVFQPFFEAIINHGFSKWDVNIDSPYVQAMLNVSFGVVTNEDFDPIFASNAFELIEMCILAMNTRFVPFLPTCIDKVFEVFTKLEGMDAFDGHMLHYLAILKIFFAGLYVDPNTVLQFLKTKNFTTGFFKLWIKYSDDFQGVYGCKLQSLACLSILCDSDLSLLQQQDLIGEVADLLISHLEVLPSAIKAKMDILNGEKKKILEDEEDEFDDSYLDFEYEADEADLEALKDTPIDNINVFEVFINKVTTLQQQNNEKYQLSFGGLDDNQKEIASKILEVSNLVRNK